MTEDRSCRVLLESGSFFKVNFRCQILRMPNIDRAFVVAFGLAVAASGILWVLGDTRGSVAAGVVAASVVVLLGGRNIAGGSPVMYWLGFGLLASSFLILGFPLVVIAGSLMALFALHVGVNVVSARRIGRLALEPLTHPAVMEGAEDAVQEFCGAGFRAVGAFRCRIAGRPITLTVMIAPERMRLAVITDKVWQVVSRFGGRSLVTSNSGMAPLPRAVLRQHLGGARPAELIRAHATALALLDRRSIRPDTFASDTDALDAVHGLETSTLGFIRKASLMAALRMAAQPGRRSQVLEENGGAQDLIDAWLGG